MTFDEKSGLIALEFKNLKPVSLNHYQKITTRGKFASKYKPEASNNYDKRIMGECYRYKPLIWDFESSLDVTKHALRAVYIFEMPRTKLIVKKGHINHKSGDVDNLVKPIQDQVFRFMNKLDDSIILEMIIKKVVSPDENYNIKVSYEKINFTDDL